MDVTTPLIFASIFVLASISLFLVYKYGIKKKSYEEVLAEQRRQTNAILGASKPTKLKEKKINKKAAKKLNKEKAASQAVTAENDVTSGSEDLIPEEVKKSEDAGRKLSKVHVEFKEQPEELPLEPPPVEKEVKEVVNKKLSKKAKPILVKKTADKKTAVSNSIVQATPVENHFEDIHPKDELELMRATIEEEVTVKSEASKQKKKPLKKTRQPKPVDSAQKPAEAVETVEEPLVTEKVAETSTVPPVPEPVITKEKKKKKNEVNSRLQLTSERDQLIHSVRNAELSRTEVQLLIDLLLNKQLEAPAVIDDWSEGKSDPIQKLKKQLADKEKQLSDEQETLAGVQAKLKEVRNEQLAERAQFQQKLRTAEESKLEIVAAHHRLQQKIEELEDVRNEQVISFQRLLEENNALQLQRSQLEATLISFQEAEALIHSLKAENLHLNKQCQLLTQQRQEQDTNYQNCLLQIQNLERNRTFDLTVQQEEIRKKHEQQLHRLAETHAVEEQRLNEMINELKGEIQQLKEETSVQLNGSSEESKVHQVKILNLTNELTSVRNELNSVHQTLLEVETKYQNELAATLQKCSAIKVELDEQKVKNDELRKKNWKVMEALNAAESRNKTIKNADQILTQEQNAHKQFLQRLFPDIVVTECESSDEWQSEFEKAVRAHLTHSKSDNAVDVAKLHSEVQHYKQIIDETEGILKKLESHIEEEERNWRTKLSEKDAEIQELKEQRTSQLQIKVSNLEDQLAQAQAENVRLLEERRVLEPTSKNPPPSLVGEKDLGDFLRLEQIKNSEAGIYQNGATSS